MRKTIMDNKTVSVAVLAIVAAGIAWLLGLDFATVFGGLSESAGS